MTLTDFLLVALATQRLCYLWLTQPIFMPAKQAIGKLGKWAGYLATCQVCLSVWCAVLVLGLWAAGTPWRWSVWVLALSGMAMVLNGFIEMMGALLQRWLRL